MILVNGPSQYSVDSLVAKSSSSNFYVCSSGEKKYFLQIAATTEQNAKLDFASYILKEMKQVSDKLEIRFRSSHPNEQLNYDWLFPTVIESFLPSNQGNRSVNILAVNGGALLDQMVPLCNILHKDRKIIDLATSVWIIGRLLRLLVLAHDQCISLRLYSDNIIIEPKNHHVVVLDWINAKMYQDEIPEKERVRDIASVAYVALEAIGESDSKPFRYSGNIYVDFLRELATSLRGDIKGVYSDFESAHGQIFNREVFYPFTTFPI